MRHKDYLSAELCGGLEGCYDEVRDAAELYGLELRHRVPWKIAQFSIRTDFLLVGGYGDD